jgi:hypothetical protein
VILVGTNGPLNFSDINFYFIQFVHNYFSINIRWQAYSFGLETSLLNDVIYHGINPLKSIGNYMYHLL